MEIGDRLPTATLLDSNGEPVELRDYIDRPTIVQFLRYFG